MFQNDKLDGVLLACAMFGLLSYPSQAFAQACSDEQLAVMRQARLSQQQIDAACKTGNSSNAAPASAATTTNELKASACAASGTQRFDAAFRLGRAYEVGDGVLQNFVEAYSWYSKAAISGTAAHRQAVDSLETKMSKQDVAAAQQRDACSTTLPQTVTPTITPRPQNCRTINETITERREETLRKVSNNNMGGSQSAACNTARRDAQSDLKDECDKSSRSCGQNC